MNKYQEALDIIKQVMALQWAELTNDEKRLYNESLEKIQKLIDNSVKKDKIINSLKNKVFQLEFNYNLNKSKLQDIEILLDDIKGMIEDE